MFYNVYVNFKLKPHRAIVGLEKVQQTVTRSAPKPDPSLFGRQLWDTANGSTDFSILLLNSKREASNFWLLNKTHETLPLTTASRVWVSE